MRGLRLLVAGALYWFAALALGEEFVIAERVPSNLDRQAVIDCLRDAFDARGWKVVAPSPEELVVAEVRVGGTEIRARVRLESGRLVAAATDWSGFEFEERRRGQSVRYLMFIRDDVNLTMRMVSLALDAMSRKLR